MTIPYHITQRILDLVADSTLLMGKLTAKPESRPAVRLRKRNRIRTIYSTLAIEGNTLSLDQVTAVVEGKRVIGPKDDIREVLNAVDLYGSIAAYDPLSEKDMRAAHGKLMRGLVPDAGNYRSGNVGVLSGRAVAHVAPQPKRVPALMGDLFAYLADAGDTNPLITSSVFHYELEFIHPFSDGNGRMGRFWQGVILTRRYPVFEFLPVESFVRAHQEEYYRSLAAADEEADATAFIEFMLTVIREALADYHALYRPQTGTVDSRLAAAAEHFGGDSFQRRDYLALFKDISPATASRDLRHGTDTGILSRRGAKRTTVYRFRGASR